MKRRDFIRNMSAGAAGLALSRFPMRMASAQPDPDAPNILFILLEDLPDWVGCMGGHPDTLTPNIDELASRSVLFTNAHCTSPICNPSRTSIFTGLRPSTTGVYYNDDDWRDIVPPEHTTMPRHLSNNGYHMVRSGKLYHGTFDERQLWDILFDGKRTHTLGGHDPYAPGHPNAGVNFEIEGEKFFNWGPTDEPQTQMADWRRVRFANNILQEGSLREPFFLGFGTMKAHFPAIVPRRVLERFNPAEVHLPPVNPNDLDDIPLRGLQWVEQEYHEAVVGGKQWHKAVASYLATIHFMDEMVGRLIAQFDDSPYTENTIVILCADHGFHLGEKMHWRKGTLWNESTQVILTVMVPGLTPPGTVCTQPVSLLDLYPTLNELCGLPTLPTLEGTSLVPQLTDPTTPRGAPAIVTLEANNHAILDQRWRYIHYETDEEELYDRWNDPNEWTNLAGDPQYQPIINHLAQFLPPRDTRGR